MELTQEQIEFLDAVCEGMWELNNNGKVDVDGNVFMDGRNRNITEIPVKFGKIEGWFSCADSNLTTLKNCPDSIVFDFYCEKNNLTDYFKSIKKEDFPHWENLPWGLVLDEYPFLINIAKKYLDRERWGNCLENIPLTKLYYKD
jgi:hypothetical protein